jgi:hypothetical protein
MQQGVESLFGPGGSLAEKDAGLARNAAGRVHLARVAKFLQGIEQQHDDIFMKRGARLLRRSERGSR